MMESARIACTSGSWSEVFLNPREAGGESTPAESVAAGHSVMQLHRFASAAECMQLLQEATTVASGWPLDLKHPGRTRMPVKTALSMQGQGLCDSLIVRALGVVETEFPLLHAALFREHGHTVTCINNPCFTFAVGEPGINIYTAGGQFEPHEDKQSLTILVTLSSIDAYDGGGTMFWPNGDSMGGSESVQPNTEDTDPAFIVRPPAGTALLFGGRVTHAGQTVLSGERGVFVCSLSLQDTAEVELAAFMQRTRLSL